MLGQLTGSTMPVKNTNLKATQDTHTTLLHNTIHRWSKKEPDVQIISSEGCTIYTQRILLGFYSPLLCTVLDKSDPGDKPSISIPYSASTLKKLLALLATGKAFSPDKSDLVEVARAAKALGIHLKDWAIPDKIEVITIVKDEPDDTFSENRPRRIRPRRRKGAKRRARSVQGTSSLQHSDMISGRESRRNVKSEPQEMVDVGQTEINHGGAEDMVNNATADDTTLDELDDVLKKYNALIDKTHEKQASKPTVSRRTRSATPNKRRRGKLSISIKKDPEKKTFGCEQCGKN